MQNCTVRVPAFRLLSTNGSNVKAAAGLTATRDSAVIVGLPQKAASRRNCPAGQVRPGQTNATALPGNNDHETHLPSLEDPPCSHSRIPRSHENPRRAVRYQRASRQRAQAAGCLNGSSPRSPNLATLLVRRLKQTSDFAAVLTRPIAASSTHFAVHWKAAVPIEPRQAGSFLGPNTLSTQLVSVREHSVDNYSTEPPDLETSRTFWLGVTVPKRFARNAVTRSLLKRQIRNAMERCAPNLVAGLWIVRLRHGFDRANYRSAASDGLRYDVAAELDALMRSAAINTIHPQQTHRLHEGRRCPPRDS